MRSTFAAKTPLSGYFSRVKNYDTYTKAVLLLLILSFINLFASLIGVFAVGIYLITRRDVAADIFKVGSNRILFIFIALSFIVSLARLNFLGVLSSIFFFFIVVAALFSAQNMTGALYEDIISTFIGYSVIAAVYAAIEYIIGVGGDAEYRCSSTFANPLYYSYFITFAVIFCTYRIITRRRGKAAYIPIILLNCFGMILSGSRMPWIGMAIGIFLILLLRRKYKLIAIFAAAALVLIAIFMIFPDLNIFAGLRLDKINVSYEGRKPYWDLAVKGIFDKPVFGHGMTGVLNDTMKQDKNLFVRFFEGGDMQAMFKNMKHHGWKTHAHNILLDCLYSYGIVGSLLLFIYGLKKGISFFKTCGYSASNRYFSLLCAVVICIAINGLVDCEIVGLQTCVFSFLAFSVIGVYDGEDGYDKLYKLEPRIKG